MTVSGQAGSAPTGAAGSIVSGAAGSIVSGAAGTSAGGVSGGGISGRAGTTGAAGATGMAGTTGAAGRGGATGTGGAAGRGGTAGTTTGAAGRGGTTGTGGAAGRGVTGTAGTTGSAGRGGTTGRGGSTGTAGTTGTGGGLGNSCPLGGRLDCTSAGSLHVTPDGQIVDFSAAEWNNTTSKWCDAHGLDGGVYAFAGAPSTATAAVDTTAQNLKLNLMVTAGGYAGGYVGFDSCVDASSFNSIQFTASLTAGSLTGCVWQVQLQTQNERATTLTNPSGGTCNSATTTCSSFPLSSLAAATATATTFTARFSSFDNPSSSTIATQSQLVGVQWQVNSGNSGSGTCTVELRIDNVKFVTQ